LRLRTIGGLWIEGEPSPPLGPRPMALLSLVAATGKKGVSRDRVVGILWSETDEEQGRHALSQTVYRLRRDTGRDWIVATPDFRLGPSVSSDIGDLQAAVAAGELETVAVLYTGRFLDGFYLPGAPEFERWVEEERAGLHREALRAIEQLAKHSDEAGNSAEAVRWWRRLTELDPLSARFALGHMRALVAVGDRSGALSGARFYTETVHRELNAEPDQAVRQLEQSLRAAPPAAPPVVSTPAPLTPTALATTIKPEEPIAPQSRPGRVRWLVPIAALVGIVVLGLAVRGFGSRASEARPFLAVGEIRTESAPDTTRLGPILRDMLATSLGGIEGLQVLANSRLMELIPRSADTVPGATTAAARRAGATELIEGELTTDRAGLVLSLRRVTVGSGVVRKGYRVRAADRYAIVDSATAAIARDLRLTPPATTAAQIRTSSPAAYALYDEGLRAYYGYDASAAYRLMSAALVRDSNFAMAAYYVWHLSDFLHGRVSEARILPQLKRLALRSIERERLLIQASVAENDEPLPRMVALAETLSVKYPEDPDGQILLGQVRNKQGDWAGAVAAFERAFVLDSVAGALSGPYCRVCRTIALMVSTYTWWDSLGAAERASRRLIAVRPNEAGTWNNLIEPLLRLGRRAEAEDAWAKQADPNGDWSGYLMHRDLIRWGHYEQTDRELIVEIPNKNATIRSDAWWLLLLSLRDQGRLREADTLVHRWRVANTRLLLPEPGPEPVDLALLALEMGRPAASIRAHRGTAAGIVKWDAPPAIKARNIVWQLTLAGTGHAAAGDTSVVRRLADSLELLGPTSNYGRDAKLHHFLSGLLLQQQGRHAEAVDAFKRSLYSLSDGYTRTNLMLARSLLVLQRPAEAIAVLRPAIHGGVDGSNSYVSRTELHEALAEAFEQAGQRDSAVVHWRAVESAWRRADPQFRERYLHAKLKAGL
jgi:DNA-binding SARP family transcriptional activator/tetratricopeptide (TPR) repeat protein